MIYISVFLVLMSVAYTVFRVCQDSYVGLMRNADDITRTLRAGERWRADVRRASAAPQFAQDERGPYVIIPQPDGEVAYQLTDGSVWRFTSPDVPPEELVSRVKTSIMEPDPRTRVTGFRWSLELQSRTKGPNVRPRFVFIAVPTTPPAP